MHGQNIFTSKGCDWVIYSFYHETKRKIISSDHPEFFFRYINEVTVSKNNRDKNGKTTSSDTGFILILEVKKELKQILSLVYLCTAPVSDKGPPHKRKNLAPETQLHHTYFRMKMI